MKDKTKNASVWNKERKKLDPIIVNIYDKFSNFEYFDCDIRESLKSEEGTSLYMLTDKIFPQKTFQASFYYF